MVMEYAGKGAYHGHTTDGHAELGATARTGASPRPRRTAVCTRAPCCTAEDRRWDAGADGTPAHAVARQGLLKPRDPATVYAWLTHYRADGLAGLTGHRHGGYRRSRLRPRGARQPRAGSVL